MPTRFDGTTAPLRRAVLAVLAAIGLQAQTNPEDLLKVTPAPGIVHRSTYGPDPLQFAELRLPEGAGPFPVAIVVHGGCWQGAIDGLPVSAVSLDLVRPLATALTEAGFATLNVEYRRVGNPGGAWPGTFHDVAAATDSVRGLAKTYPLDLKRVIVVGHSAGGHLAEWIATRHKLPHESAIASSDPLRIAGVVNLDGPADLHFPADVAFCPGAVETLMGGRVAEQPQRYREASAASYLPLGVPQDIFVSHAFGSGWHPFEVAYGDAATKAGDVVRVHFFPKSNHFDLINPRSDVWPEILKAAKALVR